MKMKRSISRRHYTKMLMFPDIIQERFLCFQALLQAMEIRLKCVLTFWMLMAMFYPQKVWLLESCLGYAAVTARISLIGHWHPGNQNNAYCDDFYFKVTDSKYRKVAISGRSDAKAGETVNLVANNGISQKPKDFTWISECSREAGVDDKGRVTLYSKYNPEVGVIIYARDSAGNVGSFFFGDGMENTDIEPDVISGQNNPDTEGKQTANTNTNNDNKVKAISGVKVRQKGTTVYMDWKKYKGADYYLLHEYNFNKKKWEAVGFLTKDKIRGKITGLKKNKEYWYMVTAEKRTSTGNKTIAKTKIVKVKIK